MKRILSVIFLLLYAVSAIGINGTMHFCDGKLSSVSVGLEKVQKCACLSKKMRKNCCEDKEFSFKIKDNQLKTNQFTLNVCKTFTQLAYINQDYTSLGMVSFLQNELYRLHHPPDNMRAALYIVNQVFII